MLRRRREENSSVKSMKWDHHLAENISNSKFLNKGEEFIQNGKGNEKPGGVKRVREAIGTETEVIKDGNLAACYRKKGSGKHLHIYQL